jgi:Tfp pilus assembly protein PilO
MNRNVRFLLVALATTAAFLLPFIIYASTAVSQSRMFDQKTEQMARLRGRVSLLHASATRVGKIQQELPLMEAELARQRAQLPAQPSVAAFRKEVEAAAASGGCSVAQLLTQKPFLVSSALTVQRFRVEIECDRNALPKIVHDLESSAVLTTIEGATIKPVDETKAKLTMVADRYGINERYGFIEN